MLWDARGVAMKFNFEIDKAVQCEKCDAWTVILGDSSFPTTCGNCGASSKDLMPVPDVVEEQMEADDSAVQDMLSEEDDEEEGSVYPHAGKTRPDDSLPGNRLSDWYKDVYGDD